MNMRIFFAILATAWLLLALADFVMMDFDSGHMELMQGMILYIAFKLEKK